MLALPCMANAMNEDIVNDSKPNLVDVFKSELASFLVCKRMRTGGDIFSKASLRSLLWRAKC